MTTPDASAVLFTVNLGPLTRFYRDAAGLRVVHTAHDHVHLDGEGFRLTLHAIPGHLAGKIRIESPPVVRENGAMKLSFRVDDVDAACKGATAAGGAFVDREQSWEYDGMRVFPGHDPDGNVVQVWIHEAS